MRKLSIIIVNYNSGDYLINCLRSIIDSVKIDYEVIIIDNNSTDNSFNISKNSIFLENFKFIHSDKNLGFSKANNLGFNYSNGEIIHFLNPDTIIPNSMNKDYITALSNKNFVYVNKLINPDKSLVKSNHLIPTIGNYIKSIFGKGEKWHLGASIIISRENFIKVNKWNENYFLYSEDLDLFYNINKQNIKIETLDSLIFHAGGACSSNSLTKNENNLIKEKAEKLFYCINKKKWQYPLIKFIHKCYSLIKND